MGAFPSPCQAWQGCGRAFRPAKTGLQSLTRLTFSLNIKYNGFFLKLLPVFSGVLPVDQGFEEIKDRK